MNTKVLLILSLPLLAHCSINDNNPTFSRFSNSEKLIFELNSVKEGRSFLNISGYEPFYLIYVEEDNFTGFIGYDGCNWLRSEQIIRGHISTAVSVGSTARGCGANTYPIDFLLNEHTINFNNTNTLYLNNKDGLFVFKTGYPDVIRYNKLIGKKWPLISSNDTLINNHEHKSGVTLNFDSNRNFRFEWKCQPDNIFGCNQSSGIWGVNNNKIKMYRTTTSVSKSSFPINDLINSSNFRIRNNTLFLSSENGEVIHTFKK